MITKIISGGQTGADRGGLDAAIHCQRPHGGWCPKGRKAEDGIIPADGTVVAFSPITVTGLVSDSGATVTVNGVPATVTSGVFVADGIVLQEWTNTISVSGTDTQSNTNQVSVDVTLSSASPTHLDPLWGPIEWVKQTLDEEMFTANFSNCELSAQYELVLINGTSGGANRVTQGLVLLNGVEVVSAQDFTVAQRKSLNRLWCKRPTS